MLFFIPIPRLFTVKEKTAAIIENLGRFSRVAQAGLHLLTPFERRAGIVSLRIQELNVRVETKTIDDVFVHLMVAVQYFVMPNRIREAFYELSNPQTQIESYVYDEVRAQVPRMKLDEVFQNKDDIAVAVKSGLEETMNKYGYGIVKALVNDVDPAPNVKTAMNEINAAQRMRKAAEQKGEAEKILRVKQAEAEAQSAILRGEGIAGQRKAIIDGLRQSVEEFQRSIPDSSAEDVMRIVILSQYFDTLKEIGAGSNSNVMMIPHSPGAIDDIASQIQMGVMTGNMATRGMGTPKATTPRRKAQSDHETTTQLSETQREAPSEHKEHPSRPHDEPQDIVDQIQDKALEAMKKFLKTSPPRN
jgi:regulator of protease activity HflC (stomatin/prohibitin superfamily)